MKKEAEGWEQVGKVPFTVKVNRRPSEVLPGNHFNSDA